MPRTSIDPYRSRGRTWLAGMGLVLVALALLVAGSALAGPAAPPPGPVQPAVPGATPGQPAVKADIEVATSDIIEGLDRMTRSGQKLSGPQAKVIRRVLVRQGQNMQMMDKSDPLFRSVLTTDQLKVVEEARSGDALKIRLGKGRPSRPGADPLVDRVVEILEKRSNNRDGKRTGI